MLASVPDIITVLDSETGEAIHTERLRYGQRVSVIACPCDPIWRSAGGLAAGRPAGLRLRLRLRPGRGAGGMSDRPIDLRLGIDVGGTNTDAVVLDRDGRVAGQGQTTDQRRRHNRYHRRPRRRPPRARRRAGPDRPRHAGHDPRHQRRARAPAPGAGGGGPHRRPVDHLDPAALRLAGRPPRGRLGGRGDRRPAASSSTAARSSRWAPTSCAASWPRSPARPRRSP